MLPREWGGGGGGATICYRMFRYATFIINPQDNVCSMYGVRYTSVTSLNESGVRTHDKIYQ